MRVVKERAEQIKAQEIKVTGGNEDTDFAAKSQAEKEYHDFVQTMRDINEVTGKKAVDIDGLLERLESATVEQYLQAMRQMRALLEKIKGN